MSFTGILLVLLGLWSGNTVEGPGTGEEVSDASVDGAPDARCGRFSVCAATFAFVRWKSDAWCGKDGRGWEGGIAMKGGRGDREEWAGR